VVFFHIRIGLQSYTPDWMMALFGKGYLAVDLFFMLSGFVLWLNYADSIRGRGLSAAPHFLGRRLARIWPLHAFVLSGAVAFALARELGGTANRVQYPWSELPMHLLLVQNWGFTDRLTWNDPAWSISCEFAAYLLFPLLAVTIDWRRVPSGTLLAIVGLLAAALHLIMSVNGASTLGDDIPRFGLLRALIEFCIGTILCALWMRRRDGSPLRPLFALTPLGVATMFGAVPETLGAPLCFALLLLALGLTPSSRANPFSWRWVVYLGEISYATYLAHFLLYIAFKLAFVEDPTNVSLPMVGLFLATVLAASVLLHHGLERPAQRAINGSLTQKRLRPAAETG
jgi:peptidoglycan/LPS O-acetylase OafA/YrhL